jgi:hypothetical protein
MKQVTSRGICSAETVGVVSQKMGFFKYLTSFIVTTNMVGGSRLALSDGLGRVRTSLPLRLKTDPVSKT